MKYLSEYRDPALARALIGQIRQTASRRWTLMEVCGGQTHTIVKQGLDELLGESVEMIHGPGCPVCVTPLEQIDRALTRRHAECRLHKFRRHASGAGKRVRSAPGPGTRRTGPRSVFAAGCCRPRPKEP